MTDDRITQKCDHYWCYPHGTIQGRKENEVAVVRYCSKCERREVAFVATWQKAKGDYARDEHFGVDIYA